MGSTQSSFQPECFATATSYVSDLRHYGNTRRLYLEEELARVGVTNLFPYMDEQDSNKNLLYRFHMALANSYFLEYYGNTNHSFLADICAVAKPVKLEHHRFQIKKADFDITRLTDNTSTIFQEYQSDICSQLASKTMATQDGILVSCGIRHVFEESMVLEVATTTIVTAAGADPAAAAASKVTRIMGGEVRNKKNTLYNEYALLSTLEIAAREAEKAKVPQDEEEEKEVVITRPAAALFLTVTIPSVIGMLIFVALLLMLLACCVGKKGGKDKQNRKGTKLKISSLYHPTVSHLKIFSLYHPTVSHLKIFSLYHPTVRHLKIFSLYYPTVSHLKIFHPT
ncbi:unnamed protein product, partial [Cyprideis torosa]